MANNMGWLVVLLLGLAAGTQLLPSNDPTSYSTGGGPAHQVRLSDHTTVSVSEWSFSFWVHPTADGGYSYFFEAQSYAINMYWRAESLELNTDASDATVATAGKMPVNKWFFALIGSTAAMTYGVVTLKAGTQYFLTVPLNVALAMTTNIHILSGCGLNKVRTM